MKILKTIVVFVFLMTAVLNQDLQRNETEIWTLLTPTVYCNNNSIIEIDEKEIICDLPQDILRNLITETARKFGADELTLYQTSIHDNKFLQNVVFSDGYFYDQRTETVYAWDISQDYLSALDTTVTKQYGTNGSTATFLKFETIVDTTLILQLGEKNNDVWSTNISFLFITNKQLPTLCVKRIPEFIRAYEQPSSEDDKIEDCDTGLLKIEISASVLMIVIIVVIVCMCILRKKCLKHPKQRIRISYLKKITEHAWHQYEAFKKPVCEQESEYKEVIEIHEYFEIGNGNKKLFDHLGNKLERETPIYECPYTMNKSVVPINGEPTQSDKNDVTYAEISWEE